VSSLAGTLSAGPRASTRAVAVPRLGAHAATVVGVAAVLAAVAFGAEGGLRLERVTWTEIGLVLTGTALVLAALLTGRMRGRVHGGLTLLALAVLTVLTAASISWSLFPAGSWEEANRTFSYLVAFAGALAFVRIVPLRWAAVLEGVALACVVVCGWALLTKVFPSALAHDETFARLRDPFGYWNAVGLMAVLGMPPLLWLAARRSGHGAVNALAWPALALLDVALMLSYSRGALLALLVGLVFWFAAVPLRLRSALPLVTAAVVAAPVIAWAFARDALSTDNVPLAARVDAGHSLGALLLLVCAILLAAGLVVNFVGAGRSPKPRTRRLAGQAVGGVLVLSVLAVVIGLAAAPGGIDGQVSKAWRKVTDPNVAAPTNTPDRLTATSSVRAQYWQEALRIYKDSKLVGAGAGAYEVARTRYRRGTQSIRHAHGYGVQTLADLGLVGLGVSLFGAFAWIVAATGATGLRRRDRGLPYDPERIGLLTMSTVVLVFAFHSLIDWTWFVPGTVAVALLCAGWVAGRGPLRARLEGSEEPAVATRWWRPDPATAVAAFAVVVLALTICWTALQPVRAAHAEDRSADLASEGKLGPAAAEARQAADRNPLSVDPLFELAFIQDAQGKRQDALATLEAAVHLQPDNSETWRRLGRYRLSVLNDPKGALRAFRAAYFLDPQSARGPSDYLEAARAARGQP